MAQLVEQLIRNQQVVGSSPIFSSMITPWFRQIEARSFLFCGRSLVAEPQLPKLIVRVRFPSPAPPAVPASVCVKSVLLFIYHTHPFLHNRACIYKGSAGFQMCEVGAAFLFAATLYHYTAITEEKQQKNEEKAFLLWTTPQKHDILKIIKYKERTPIL